MGEIVDDLAQMLGMALHGLKHARDDESKLDFVGSRLSRILVTGAQVFTHFGVGFLLREPGVRYPWICNKGGDVIEWQLAGPFQRGMSEVRWVRLCHANRGTMGFSFRLKLVAITFELIWLSDAALPERASAITAELARTCKALTTKQFPPRELDNPAAGTAPRAAGVTSRPTTTNASLTTARSTTPLSRPSKIAASEAGRTTALPPSLLLG